MVTHFNYLNVDSALRFDCAHPYIGKQERYNSGKDQKLFATLRNWQILEFIESSKREVPAACACGFEMRIWVDLEIPPCCIGKFNLVPCKCGAKPFTTAFNSTIPSLILTQKSGFVI